MKRNLNEGAEFEYGNSIKICVSEIRNDDPELDCNELRDMYVEAGANVEGSHGQYNGKAATFMTVSDLHEDEIMEILNDFLSNSDVVRDAEEYIISEDSEMDYPAYDDVEDKEYPTYEDVDIDSLDPEEDQLNDELDNLNENDGDDSGDILEDAKDELQDLLDQLNPEDSIDFDDPVSLNNFDVLSIDGNGILVTDDDEEVNAMELNDSDDIYALCDAIRDELEAEAEYPAYDDVDIEDDLDELPRFEKFHKNHRLEEKKKNDCCPGTGKVNESDAIDAVLADIDAQLLKESEEVEEKNQKELKKKTLKALAENQHSLHTNVRYNGKSFDKMTLKELQSLYERINSTIEELSNRTLNESVVEQKTIDTINKKKQLLEFLDEEITYRTTRMKCLKKLNEDGAEISDEELANLFGPAQGEEASDENNSNETSDENSDNENNDEKSDDENKDDETSEDDEVVELSRIEITLKDTEAANDLKQACLDADIPEDAFELENVEDEDATEDEENSEENNDEENSEEQQSDKSDKEQSDETSDENTNESYEFAKYVKMLAEGEIVDEQPAEETSDENNSDDVENNSEDNSEENTEDSDNSEEEEDKQPKFILTNTDYASKLAKVLEDIYGISKEEFEEMIGGKIEEKDENDEKKSEESEDNSEEKSGDSEEKSGDSEDSEEEIDPSDLFKNL